MNCVGCETEIGWISCPTGGWWAHRTHPDDGHDALPRPGLAPDFATAITLADNEAGCSGQRYRVQRLACRLWAYTPLPYIVPWSR